MTKKQKRMLTNIIASALLLILANLISCKIIAVALFIAAYIIVGSKVIKKAVMGIYNLRPFDENFLMVIATFGAFLLEIFNKSYNFNEAVFVMLFYAIGELFENIAIGKSRKNIVSLIDIRQEFANLEDGTRVNPKEVEIGTIIVVNPGEKIPIDGVITDGSTTIDTSSITGESIPQDAYEGISVISGCINLSGVIKIKTQTEYENSTASKILNLVENASNNKSSTESFITKFAKKYTPIVVFFAIGLAILPPLVNLILGNSLNLTAWIYRALTFLVISCPCALVISIPLTFFAGLGGASKNGVLIEGSNYIEALSKTDTVVFDKTGTLTSGKFTVSAVHHNEIEKEKIIEYAALCESASNHPIAKSIVSCYGKKIDKSRIKDIKEHSGFGITALIDGKSIAVGNDKLMQKINCEYKECHHASTVIHIAENTDYLGHIVIEDVIKPQSYTAVNLLKKLGIKNTVMLTGDTEKSAENIAKKLNIDKFFAKLLPQDKVKITNELKKTGKIAFVGDGINDSPVIATADVGIAMGLIGSDAAIEAADVVLTDDNPIKVYTAIMHAKKCLRIAKQNIIFALSVKAICLLLGAIGIANMWIAIFADVGVMVIAVLNAIRAIK